MLVTIAKFGLGSPTDQRDLSIRVGTCGRVQLGCHELEPARTPQQGAGEAHRKP